MNEKRKIVVVDNNNELQKGIKTFYESDDAVEVVDTFNDVNKTIDYVKENNVDIVVTDLVLPNADGYALIEGLKALPNCPKIIVASAIFEDQFIKRAFALGVSYYMINL